MKRALMIAALLIISFSAPAQMTVKEGLGKLEKQYDVHFVYDSTLPLDKSASPQALDAGTFRGKLRRLLKGSGVEFEIRGRQVALRRSAARAPLMQEQMDSLSEVQLLDSAKVVDWRERALDVPVPGSFSISRLGVLQAPVLLGEKDLLKTLQMLPGVQAANEGFSGISVRGGYADENLILLDGVPVYNCDHLLGLFSVFPAEAIGGATLYKGSFPARYGGRASSVLDVRTAEGNGEGLRGSVSVGLLSGKVHLDGPLGARARASFSARTLHTLLAEPVLLLLDNSTNIWFYDINGRLDYELGSKDKLSFTAYNGRDLYREAGNGSQGWTRSKYAWGNTVAALRWTHADRLHASLAYTGYGVSNAEKSGKGTESSGLFTGKLLAMDTENVLRDVLFGVDGSAGAFEFGGRYTLHMFNPKGQTRQITDIYNDEVQLDTLAHLVLPESSLVHEAALYVQACLELGKAFSLAPGFRLSLFSVPGKVWLCPEPRLALRFSPSESWSAEASYTRMVQGMHRIPSTFTIMPADAWRPVSAKMPPMTSDQWSLSLDSRALEGWGFSAEAWYKRMSGVAEYRSSYPVLGTSYSLWERAVASGEGYGWGVELLARKTAGRLTGWAAYTLSRVWRQFPDGSINDGKPFPARTDRRHRINLCATYSFNERIDLTAAWTFGSGTPITIPERRIQIMYEDGLHKSVYYAPSRGNYRLEPVHRADVSVNFRKPLKRGDRVWSVGLYNLYGARNPDAYSTEVTSAELEGSPVYFPDYPEGTPMYWKNTILMFFPSVSYTRNF